MDPRELEITLSLKMPHFDEANEEITLSLKMPHFDEAKEEIPSARGTSLGLLKVYGNKVKRLRGEMLNEQRSNVPKTSTGFESLSPNGVMKLARAQLLQLKTQNADVFSVLSRSFGAQSGLSYEVPRDLELAMLIQAAAEHVANKKIVSARKLLSICHRSATVSGNPVQRVVYHFAEALEEKIDREWGIVLPGGLEAKFRKPLDVEQTLISLEPAMVERQQELPILVISEFTGIQSILDSVASAKRVHIIDFGIRNGSHWTIIMQALADRHSCPLEMLKITAVGTSKAMMEETGKWLSSFARTMNLTLSFKIVVSDLKDLKQDLFEVEADETVAVYFGLRLFTVLPWPNHLEAVIGVIKHLKPCAIVMVELEANLNSPVFLERFTEALCYFSAVFDCAEGCLSHHDNCRKLTEQVYLREMIQNMVAEEDSERTQRFESINFWRGLCARLGLMETELSPSALCQASLLLKRSACQDFYTLVNDGKCLILGWKGTPILSISAWKSSND
ncbi:hypothetical protein M9H77_36914 [Catharanthus roseus]|uniref:Uncharacterized protein n=1 Tax=Catharanthus roseus TaxID=4058 RepID=A0ACB9ZV13_CATRO|nr:hypothetical protein M9H77_36914 [Catharanthus roseus]